MCCGNEEGSYLRPIDSCITQLEAQGPSRTCTDSTEEEEGMETAAAGDSLCVMPSQGAGPIKLTLE